MTVNQIPAVPGAVYLRLICRLGELVMDSDDQDEHPNYVTQGGTVTLTCATPYIRYKEEDGQFRMLAIPEMTYKIRPSDGELFNPASNKIGVEILQSSTVGLDPTGFTWTANVKPERGPGWSVVIPPHLTGVFDLVEGSALVNPVEGQSTLAAQIMEHITDTTPHPAYDEVYIPAWDSTIAAQSI